MASLQVVDWKDLHYRQATIVDLYAQLVTDQSF
jgi:hypothetical protein